MVSLQLYPIPEGCEGPGCRTSGVNRAIRKMDICDEGGVNIGIEHRFRNLKQFLPGRSKVSQEGLVDSWGNYGKYSAFHCFYLSECASKIL